MEEKENIFEKAKKKFGEFKAKAKEFGGKVVDKALEHPEITLPFIVGLGSMAIGGAKAIANAGEKQLERCMVEDDVTGLKYLTDHPLNNDEILELSEKMVDGQTKGEALNDMGVLKKEKKRK